MHMSDNVTANQGFNGPVFKTDEIGGVHTPITKIAFGPDGSVVTVEPSNPLPVSGPITNAQLRSSDVNVSLDGEQVAISNFPTIQTVDVLSDDNTVMDNVIVSSVGSGNVYTTTGYSSLSFQITGIWDGVIKFSGSNDGVNFIPISAQDVSVGTINDSIYTNGIYNTSVSTKFIRYDIASIQGSANIIVVGKTDVDIDAMSFMAQAADPSTGINLSVSLAGGISKDTSGAQILSDAPNVISFHGAANSTIIIDTKGYQSLDLTTTTLVGSLSCSNDQLNWTNLYGCSLNQSTTVTNSLAATTSYTFPCLARFIKLSVTTAGEINGFLRNVPWSFTGMSAVPNNLAYIAGTATVTAGVNGTLAVGGNIAVGSSQTTNPLVVGGVDASNLTRRIRTDVNGDVVVAGLDQTQQTRSIGVLAPSMSQQNVASIPVQHTETFDGLGMSELMGLILIELRMMNFYISQLPDAMGSSQNQSFDSPDDLRNNYTTNN